jgi:hypothetical protein
MSTPSNTLRFEIDMLDETPKHGSRIRIVPLGGRYPFWVNWKDLGSIRKKVQRKIGASFSISGPGPQRFNQTCTAPNRFDFLRMIGHH